MGEGSISPVKAKQTHQGLALALIVLAFMSGTIAVTAMTSGCDANRNMVPVSQANTAAKVFGE